jgi:NAD(P)-dependent dehydrogenase (short-subunit alcohol dehydrogenase family)
MNDSSRVWFVTGCSSGFGRALAERIVAEGDLLIATARQAETLSTLADLAPDSVRVLALDVTDPVAVRRVVNEAHAAWGRLDVIVNNAGYGLLGALEECGDDQIARNFATNLLGPIHVMRAALPLLRARRSGHIVNLSAAAAIANYAGFGIYGGAKCGLEGVSEAVRAEAAPLGIKVTLVQPGPFRTDFIARSLERAANPIADYNATSGKFAQFLERVSGRQPGDPERAAAAIVKMVRDGRAPQRLVLGRYAADKVRKTLKAREAELNEWESVALATDFPA